MTLQITPARPELVAADTAARTISGLALPYGAAGSTSAGRVTVRAGAVKIPTDRKRVKLLDDHRPAGKPVGYLDAVRDDADGLGLTFTLGSSPAADAALTAAAEHTVDGLSVELVDVERTGSEIVSATLAAVALVAIPAFDDARVDAVNTTPPTTDPETTTTEQD